MSTIDKKNYEEHIGNISKKTSKGIGIIFKLSKLKISGSILKQVYYSFIYPYLNYNVCSHAGTYETHLNRLLLLQKRAILIINC